MHHKSLPLSVHLKILTEGLSFIILHPYVLEKAAANEITTIYAAMQHYITRFRTQ